MTIWTTCTDGARQDRIALHRLAEVNAEDWTWAALPVSCEDGPLQRTMVVVGRPQGWFCSLRVTAILRTGRVCCEFSTRSCRRKGLGNGSDRTREEHQRHGLV